MQPLLLPLAARRPPRSMESFMSTYAPSRRRTALRAAVATAALAGALLTPAAAFAVTPAQAPAAAQSSAGRYDGEKVLVYKDATHGVLAVLRNGPEGPEAWLRAVGPNWKPGDVWAVRVIAEVSRQQPTATAKEYVVGLKARLLDASGATPSVQVTAPDGSVKTYALPKGKPAAKPTTPASGAAKGCTVTRDVSIGAGTDAVMTLGPNGPTVTFTNGPGDPVPSLGKLDRNHPKLPASAGIYAEILRPYSTTPQLKTKVEGGPHSSYAVQDFPRLPKGCEPDAASPSANPSGQTSVVPKGAVAAGAEFKDGSGDRTALAAGGAGLAVAGAAGYVALRRRGAANRG
ncbi:MULTISPECIES: hypothetical protein [unclassified Streptomyces]|uniref:hypothetical protein n=1 Tax=unclassified Streptomyces TaxID=2593676 RepID=UPI003814304B